MEYLRDGGTFIRMMWQFSAVVSQLKVKLMQFWHL